MESAPRRKRRRLQKDATRSSTSPHNWQLPSLPPSAENNNPQQELLSAHTLAFKKTLLPYLDQIEYINCQLRDRGLLGHDGTVLQEQNVAKTSLSESLTTSDPRASTAASPWSRNDASTLQLPTQVLQRKYPRLCEQLPNMHALVPRDRSLHWTAKWPDLLYDAFTESVVRDMIECNSSTPASDTPLPYFTHQYITRFVGQPDVGDQYCVDFIYNLERWRQTLLRLQVFADFVSEVMVEDALLLFVVARKVLEEEMRVRLSSKNKVSRSSTKGGGKAFVETNLYKVVLDPVFVDGTVKQVLLSPIACKRILSSIFSYTVSTRSLHMETADVNGVVKHVNDYIWKKVYASEDSADCYISTDNFLHAIVNLYDDIPEEIIAEFKYNDDVEHLNSLDKLREASNDEKDINKWKEEYELQGNVVRRLHAELKRLERWNDDNQNRAQIIIVKSKLFQEDQTLQDLARNISSAQTSVDANWHSFLQDGQPSGVKLSKVGSAVNALFKFASRLKAKHDLHIKAAKALANPWRKQLEDLKLRMVIRIQRTYRARREARKKGMYAREELSSRARSREQVRKKEILDAQRLQAKQEAEQARHRDRMVRQRLQEEERVASRERQQKILLKQSREKKVRTRVKLHEQSLQSNMLKSWKLFVQLQKKKIQALWLFYKIILSKWKRAHCQWMMERNAVRVIYRSFAKYRDRCQLLRILELKAQQRDLARKYLRKLEQRRFVVVFNQWIGYTTRQVYLRRRLGELLLHRKASWFHMWFRSVVYWKERKEESAMLIQCVYRQRLARKVLQLQRLRRCAAIDIQRVYRGNQARHIMDIRRRLWQHQSKEVEVLRNRIRHRTALRCLKKLSLYMERGSRIRRTGKHLCNLKAHRFVTKLSTLAIKRKARRAAIEKQRNMAATCIQKHFRCHLCKSRFQQVLKENRAAKTIQRAHRAYQNYKFVLKFRAQRASALCIQCFWRKTKAIRVVHSRRAQYTLEHMYKGDYSATQKAIYDGKLSILDDFGNGMLHWACAGGHKRVVKLCLRHGMDINAVNKRGETPLHLLISYTNAQSYKAEQIQERINLTAYMIDHGAWHEAPDIDGLTPLLVSVQTGCVEAVELLLDRSANTDARSLENKSAIQIAMDFDQPEVLNVLLASGSFLSENHVEDIMVSLHVCAKHGLLMCLSVLLEYIMTNHTSFPSNPLEKLDVDGYTPILCAVCSGHLDITKLLLDHGVCVDQVDYHYGRSPLHYAVALPSKEQSWQLISLLINYDANLNAQDTNRDTPLHLSCIDDKWLSITELLVQNGAAISSNYDGDQPTHIAAASGAVETLKLLIAYGGDINLKNYKGQTPLGAARFGGQKAVVEYIMEAFAEDPPDIKSDLLFAKDTATKKDTVREDKDIELSVPNELGEESKDDGLPVRTEAEWEEAVSRGFKMGTIGHWTQYIDRSRGIPFYVGFEKYLFEVAGALQHTWNTPVEFIAALGNRWQLMRAGGPSVGHKKVTPQIDVAEVNDARDEDTLPDKSHEMMFYYYNRITGEIRSTVPPVSLDELQRAIHELHQRKQLRARVRPSSKEEAEGASSGSLMEYSKFYQDFEDEVREERANWTSAIKIQRHYRARRTFVLVRSLLVQNRCAIDLQRAFRGRKARQVADWRRYEIACARRIQALWQGYEARKREREGLHASRVEQRKRRRACAFIQRVFRGYRGRKMYYREASIVKLGHMDYFAWEALRKRSNFKRSFRIWDEMDPIQDFPGVLFYSHQLTHACTWDQPSEWQAADRKAFEDRCQVAKLGYTTAMNNSAIYLQSLWKTRSARKAFNFVMKAVRLMRTCEEDYLEDPTSLVKMANYVLYLHTITHDYERARPLYAKLMSVMVHRGPDIPFILFSYAIYLAVTREDDFDVVEEMIYRAKAKDPHATCFEMAHVGFFKQSLLHNPEDCESHLNYAACMQWVYGNLDEASEHYVRAIYADGHREGAMDLFQNLLSQKKLLDRQGMKLDEMDKAWESNYDGYEVFRRWQLEKAAHEDKVRREELERIQSEQERWQAAVKIQARYRRRRAMWTMNKMKNERQVSVAMLELAHEKKVYDDIQQVFNDIAASKRWFGSKKSTTLSLPISKLEIIFDKLQISPDEKSDTIKRFHAEYPDLKNVNVMDIFHFLHRQTKAEDTATTIKSSQK